jgi:uncharacterized protein YndB with AHSA1/START domain
MNQKPDPLMEEKTIRQSITIDAPKEKVWDALVNPEMTKQYMYGCVPVTDWRMGSPLLWQGEENGQVITFVKGHVIEIIPNEYLAYTVIDPNNPDIPDIPDNYLTVIYTLTEKEGTTTFHVSQGDYSKVANGDQRFADTQAQGGWMSILEAIRDLVEGE